MSYLDTRDLITERDELRQEVLDTYKEEFHNVDSYEEIDFDDDHEYHINSFDQFLKQFEIQLETIEQIDALENIIGESEFNFGVTLIPDDEFTDYAEQLAEDIEAIGDNSDWIVIDWDKTADNLKMDFSSVDYKGVDYLYR